MGEVSQEVVGLLRPSASSLASKDNQARATKLTRQLGVSALLGAACLVQSSPVSGGTLSPWGSIGRTDQSRVDRQLCTVEERQTICDHFEATVIQLASCKRSRSWWTPSLQPLCKCARHNSPKETSTPEVAHVARRWPRESSGWPHRQKADERGSGHQRRRRRRMRKHCGSKRDAGDVGEQWNGIPAMGPCCERASACSVGPNVATLHSGRKCPPQLKKRKTATQCVKCWETRHLGGTLAAALEPRRPILGRQHQLQQGDFCTRWLPLSGTHPHLWRVTPACGQQHQDDVHGSQGECLPNWPSARLTASALRFSSTNRPTQMEDLPSPTCVV